MVSVGYFRSHIELVFGLVLFLFCALVCVILCYNRKSKRVLREIAFTDSLTGLPTLTKFQRDTFQLLKSTQPKEYMLMSLDVDNFKYINDSFGYTKGNDILVILAEHFKAHKELYTLIGRGTADNFAFLLHTKDFNDVCKRFDLLCEAGQKARSQLMGSYRLVFSAGVYLVEDLDADFSAQMDRANIARKSIKGGHIDTIAEYTALMDEQVQWKREITLSMEHALEKREFQVYLQPKYNLINEQMIGAEALVRWQHPQKGLLAPITFIPFFEKNGFIEKLDFYMFEQVCRLLHDWIEAGLEPVPISVNLSRCHLNNPYLSVQLLELTERYGITPSIIETELTESIVLDNSDAMIRTMRQLKEAGFGISIDDFGSGYSSLNLLTDLPADVLKIDKGFLDRAKDIGNGRKIIIKVIELAQSLDLHTVAEGVETMEQAQLLKEIGCEIAQGYYYARPMPVEEFEKRLLKKNEYSPSFL